MKASPSMPRKNSFIVQMEPRTAKKRKFTPAISDNHVCVRVGPYRPPMHVDVSGWHEELFKREEELNRKSTELDRRLKKASEDEAVAGTLLAQYEIRSALDTLTQVEEHFTCSL